MVIGNTDVLTCRAADDARVYVTVSYRPRKGIRRKPKSATLTIKGTSNVHAVAERIRQVFSQGNCRVPA